MMRVRLRDYPDPAELAAMYAAPHDHSDYADHHWRVDVTSALAALAVAPGGTVADLSCGNAVIAKRLHASRSAKPVLGDIAPGYEHCGPIEKTIHEIGHADLFVCSETIEHLEDPDGVLAEIRAKAEVLILSTPDGETGHTNPEHVWGWDTDAVEQMLKAAGWHPDVLNVLQLHRMGYLYDFQIWVAS